MGKTHFEDPGHYNTADREKIPAEDFGDPENKKYPIVTQADVHDAAGLIGHAADPAAVKARIIRIAKRKGFSLPDAWEEDGEDTARLARPDAHTVRDEVAELLLDAINACDCAECRAMRASVATETRAADPDEEDDEEGGEDDEDQEEDETGDEAPPAKETPSGGLTKTKKRDIAPVLTRSSTTVTVTPSVRELAYIPITRIDAEKREVEGVLSNEEIDTYGTIFDHESLKRAVTNRWHGNVREMHQNIAAGRGVWAEFDDEAKQTTVRARISEGAPLTWAKILDGTLCGFSLGASNAKMEHRMIGERRVPCYTDFDLAEISLVDAPSNPGAQRSGLTVYRAAGISQDGAEFSYAPEDVMRDPTPETPTATPPVETPTPTDPAPEAPAQPAPEDPAASEPETRAKAADVPEVTTDPDTSDDPDNSTADDSVPSDSDLESAMNSGDGSVSAHVHAHAYNNLDTHMNDHTHGHDGHPHGGSAEPHSHAHMHAHTGSGDGSAPHVHLHDHGHQYRFAAPDVAQSFIPQGDPRVEAYLPRTSAPTMTREAIKPAPVVIPDLLIATTPASAVPVPRATKPAESVPVAQRSQTADPETARVGARISNSTLTGLHEGRDAILRTCNCGECQEMLDICDPDQDGDDDTTPGLDTDQDATLLIGQAMTGRAMRAQLTRAISQVVQQQTTPILQQFRALAAKLAAIDPHQQVDLTPLTDGLDAVRSALSEVKGQVEVIAAQEMPGGPVLRAADKTLAINGQSSDPYADLVLRARALGLQGMTNQPQQTGLATEMIRQQMGR